MRRVVAIPCPVAPTRRASIAAPPAPTREPALPGPRTGGTLAQGDPVVLIKDWPIEGANFTAKRSTAVRGLFLVPDPPAQTEGWVEGQRIVLLTDVVKKRSDLPPEHRRASCHIGRNLFHLIRLAD